MVEVVKHFAPFLVSCKARNSEFEAPALFAVSRLFLWNGFELSYMRHSRAEFSFLPSLTDHMSNIWTWFNPFPANFPNSKSAFQVGFSGSPENGRNISVLLMTINVWAFNSTANRLIFRSVESFWQLSHGQIRKRESPRHWPFNSSPLEWIARNLFRKELPGHPFPCLFLDKRARSKITLSEPSPESPYSPHPTARLSRRETQKPKIARITRSADHRICLSFGRDAAVFKDAFTSLFWPRHVTFATLVVFVDVVYSDAKNGEMRGRVSQRTISGRSPFVSAVGEIRGLINHGRKKTAPKHCQLAPKYKL